jgi:septum formation protein
LNALRGRRVILASASPRRKQLLSQIGLNNVEIIPSTFAENIPKSGLSPFEYVLETATQKALTSYRRQVDESHENEGSKEEPALTIAADTIVVGHFGEILEKPRNEVEHIAMLKMLRDHGTHRVFTAVACVAPLESARDPGYVLETCVEETSVKFARDLSDEIILAYVKTREGADKAGGYGIQGMGCILVEKIEGMWDNVVGLPLRATLGIIEKVLRPEGEADDSEG